MLNSLLFDVKNDLVFILIWKWTLSSLQMVYTDMNWQREKVCVFFLKTDDYKTILKLLLNNNEQHLN